MPPTFRNSVVGTLLAGYLIAVLLFLWAPYRYVKPVFFGNGATFEEAGVVFPEPGLVSSVAPAAPLVEAIAREGAFGVEMVVRSFSDRQRGDLPRILTISDGSGDDSGYNVVVGQRRDDLVVRIRTDREVVRDLRSASRDFRTVSIQVPWRNNLRRELGRDRDHPRIAVDDFFYGGERRRITITYDGQELQIFGDGQLHFAAHVEDEQFLQSWDREYFLHLGNEGDGHHPWLGQIESVRFFNPRRPGSDVPSGSAAAQTLPAGEVVASAVGELRLLGDVPVMRADAPDERPVDLELVSPRLFVHATKPFLALPGEELLSDEGLLNVVLFMPFGVLLAFWGWRDGASGVRLALLVVGAAFAFSLLAEVGQFFIAGRYSSLGDILANTTGGLVGWSLVAGMTKLKRSVDSGLRG